METDGPILLFDGICNLCSSSVQFVLKRDKTQKLKFASLQSEFGQSLLKGHKLPDDYASSIVLFENGKIHVKSSAALRTTKHLRGLWPLMQVFLIVPNFIRNWVYDLVARNRYKWFGKKEFCWIPDDKWSVRFIA